MAVEEDVDGQGSTRAEAPAARMRNADALRRPRVRLGAVIAVALAAGFVVWLVLGRNGGSGTQGQRAGAAAMTPTSLARLARSVGHPIYWLGTKRGRTYEVTRTTNGTIYVRYLPAGVAVGSSKPYLTVATYPFPGAYAAISKQARRRAAVMARLASGGLALLDNRYPESVHVAYPGVAYQVEVYDPTPARAMQLVSAGQLTSLGRVAGRAVPAATSSGPRAATIKDLELLARRLRHPIYWAGAKPGYTYELTTTPTGSVFIRYLPPGARVGDPKPRYLTVATYPFPGALAAIAKIAHGAVTIKLAGGGLGVVDRSYPKSIHLAYPRSNYQVEVYDPTPSAGRSLVASGAVAPVP